MNRITFHHQFHPVVFEGDDLKTLHSVAWWWHQRLSGVEPAIRKPVLHPADADKKVETTEELDLRAPDYMVKILVYGDLQFGASAIHAAWKHLPLEREGRSLSEIRVERIRKNAFRVSATYLGKS